MSEVINFPASVRQKAGKGAARAIRRAGQVPAIVYGDKKDPMLIAVDPKVLGQELNKTGFFTKMVDLKVDNETHRALPRDVQFHPVTDRPIHVDFLRITADTQINVAVPVIFLNEEESPGIKRGGVLNVVRHEIEVTCAAERIPQSIDIDLTGLDIGDSIHISHITLPAGVIPTITDRDFTIATVAAPTVRAEEEAAEQAAAAAALLEGEEGIEGEEAIEGVEGEEGAEGEAADKETKEGESSDKG
ncbi:MAG: 50S ribosomal protein L25/general stress protein Ctc [Alphaproteobacteria bacterium]